MNNGYYGWLKSPVNEYFADAHTSNLYVENVPLGIVHFGILPNSAHVIEYDTSLYSPIEKSTDTKFDNFSRHINFTKHISENGYSLNIIIPPEALGFTLKYGIERLKFLIDIVDVDNKNTQETLLSTSKNRKWGDPSTFNSIDLKNHIYVAINKNIPSLGQKVSYNTVYDKVIDMVSKYFVYTKKGWLPIDINDISFYEYNQPEVYVIENISKIQIKQGILKYRKEIVNNNLLEHFICSGGSYVIMNKERLLTKESIIQTIILPNGKPAFIYSEFEITGRYTRQIFSYLYLVTDTLKQLIATYGDLYPTEISLPYLDKTVKIKWGSNLEWYGGDENIDWENAIGYNKGNRFLILNLSDSLHYKITWDKEGKIIK